LQQANVTELMERMLSVTTLKMNDQQQSFRPWTIQYRHCLVLSWSCPGNCSGLVSDGQWPWLSGDI